MFPFLGWTFLSFAVVAVYQLVSTWMVGHYLDAHSLSGLNLTLVRGLLQAAGCLAAGLVVGVISPGWRVLEPALGALAASLVVSGTPWVAFPVTLVGAWLGERWSRP